VQADDLVGTWRLVSWQSHRSDGTTVAPFGGAPATGLIVYSADGFVSATLMQVDRASLGRPVRTSADVAEAAGEEVEAAFKGYMAYCGTYSVGDDGRTVTHHLECALYPDWVGTDLVRFGTLEGGRLVLTTPPVEVDGAEQHGVLVWERAAHAR
jgi:Lipocalin-like domain